jgi:hypothetical protein
VSKNELHCHNNGKENAEENDWTEQPELCIVEHLKNEKFNQINFTKFVRCSFHAIIKKNKKDPCRKKRIKYRIK